VKEMVMEKSSPQGVPAAPNESIVRGEVVEVTPVPEGMGAICKVRLQAARDVGDLANLAASRVGEVVEVYVHPKVKGRLKEGDQIEAHISYMGDERGGGFYLKGDQVRNLKRGRLRKRQ
jgi:hypothetical protein